MMRHIETGKSQFVARHRDRCHTWPHR